MSLPPFWLLAGCKVLQAVAKRRDRARMLQTVLNLLQSVADGLQQIPTRPGLQDASHWPRGHVLSCWQAAVR